MMRAMIGASLVFSGRMSMRRLVRWGLTLCLSRRRGAKRRGNPPAPLVGGRLEALVGRHCHEYLLFHQYRCRFGTQVTLTRKHNRADAKQFPAESSADWSTHVHMAVSSTRKREMVACPAQVADALGPARRARTADCTSRHTLWPDHGLESWEQYQQIRTR